MEAVTKEMSSLTIAKRPQPMTMKSAIASPVDLISNYFSINLRTSKFIVIYDVKFEPEIEKDNVRKKKSVLRKLRNEEKLNLLEPIIYNGQNLFSPKESNDNIIKEINDGTTKYIITIIKSSVLGVNEIANPKTNKKMALTAKYFLNVIIKQMLNAANFLPLGATRKYFNLKKSQKVPEFPLSVSRGYSTCINLLEGGLLLRSDFATRVINQKTAWHLINEIKQSAGSNTEFQDQVAEALVGKSLLAGYGSYRLYRIDEIDFNSTPSKEIIKYVNPKTQIVSEINLAEYYKIAYGINIKYSEQFLLINKTYKRDKETKKRFEIPEMRKKLVPELCYLTGLEDSMRTDFNLMKNLANYTKLSPGTRMNEIKSLISIFKDKDEKFNSQNLEKDNTPFGISQKWGLEFDSKPLIIKGNVLNPQQIQLEKNKFETATSNGLLNFKSQISQPMVLDNWILAYSKKDNENAENFVDTLKKSSKTFGIEIKNPVLAESVGPHSGQFIESVKYAMKPLKDYPDFVVFILPFANDYAKIKKEFISILPKQIHKAILTQVVLSKTFKKKGLMSICSNIALQMNAKRNYALWKVVTNEVLPKKTMVAGMDLSRLSRHENVIGMSSSLDPSFVKYYTQVKKVKNETENISKEVGGLIGIALDKFLEETKKFLPELIILYRDGVSDSQIMDLIRVEVPAILTVINSKKDYKPKIIICTVNKTSGVRYFQAEGNQSSHYRGRGGRGGGSGQGGLDNPSSGTYVDTSIVEEGDYEFYLMPQFVSEGSGSPVKFKVLYDNSGIPLEVFVQFTNAMCYNYFNWKGAIKTPGPCKYAKKAAEMYSKYTKDYPEEELQRKLYFL